MPQTFPNIVILYLNTLGINTLVGYMHCIEDALTEINIINYSVQQNVLYISKFILLKNYYRI